MQEYGGSTPISYKSRTSFNGSIISLRGTFIENPSSDQLTSTISSSNSDLTELSIFTIIKPKVEEKTLENLEIIQTKTCKCLIF
jgi:hypothetical protein